MSEPITEEWLKETGFKWHQLERQPDKHWLLWIGDAVREADAMFSSVEDLGIEMAPLTRRRDGETHLEGWYCWLRSDASHRYHRFLHIRHLKYQHELIRLIEGLTGADWNPELVFYGSLVSPKEAERIRAREQRLDVQIMDSNPKWYEVEKDETRGRPLIEHMEAHEKAVER